MPHKQHYNTGRHKYWRKQVIRRAGGLCEQCKRYGRLDSRGLPVEADVAHHIKDLEDFPELAYDVKNGKALCVACHNRAHPEKGGRYW